MMPSPSDSSRSLTSRPSTRGLTHLRLHRPWLQALLMLGLAQVLLGVLVVTFSMVASSVTTTESIKRSCPSWAGFSLAFSGVVGVVSWKRPFTLVISFFSLLSVLCVMLSMAGSVLSCKNAQLARDFQDCSMEGKVCVCCPSVPLLRPCPESGQELKVAPNSTCDEARGALKNLLFSVCGLTICGAVICTLSAIVCCIQIFSLDLVHTVRGGPGSKPSSWPPSARSQAPWGPWAVHQRPQRLSFTPRWTWRNSYHQCPLRPTTPLSIPAARKQMRRASPTMAPWTARCLCTLRIALLLMRSSWGYEETASFMTAPASASTWPPSWMCPWTAGLWCCRPWGTCPGARARRRTRACWSCRAPCARSTTCSSAPSSAAAPATASAWTAACAAPSRTAPCPGGPRGPPAPTPARPPRPRPRWEPPQPPAAATGWRAGRPGWDPASPSCGGGSPGEAAQEAAGPPQPLPPAPLLAASATAQVPSRLHHRLGTGLPIWLSRRPRCCCCRGPTVTQASPHPATPLTSGTFIPKCSRKRLPPFPLWIQGSALKPASSV
ncbi:protein FAM189B isoform X3 [Lontra canadensis]|uniref:protein FAM189B isoform X3 n=1 Tax=Lontra canadensis TaxID=76717 RepID=UPI0013F37B03|nr:protein FAM189B isoform X3 [Lontra canadensis]